MSAMFASTARQSCFKATLAALIAAAALSCGAAQAEPKLAGPMSADPAFGYITAQNRMAPQYPVDQTAPDRDAQLDPSLQRQIVNYPTGEAPGTIVIDTPNTFLYFVLGNGQAIRYGIGVGREGFTWSGVNKVARKAEWPDWYPPAEMIARQPYLPRMTAGGPGNPLGARALYIGGTEYRIHGTNDPATIGKDVSSGCIRLTNEDVEDLYARVQVGAKVIVLPQTQATVAQARPQRLPVVQPAPVTSSYRQPYRPQTNWADSSLAGLY